MFSPFLLAIDLFINHKNYLIPQFLEQGEDGGSSLPGKNLRSMTL
jgi:hypothetical protein